MKKNVLKKGILALLVVTLLAISFTGCGTVTPPLTGTVEITVTNAIVMGKILIPMDYTYDITMDGTPIGTTNGSGNLTIANVTVGIHTFVAFSNFEPVSGSKVQNISSGINYVTIFVPIILI